MFVLEKSIVCAIIRRTFPLVMNTHPILRHARAIANILFGRLARAWRRFRSLRVRYQILAAIAALTLLFLLSSLFAGGKQEKSAPPLRAVILSSINELSGRSAGAPVIGAIRAISEAAIRAETSGVVQYVSARIGSEVPAGFVIAELENSAARAAVLQAEGAYEAALASRAAVSPEDSAATAKNAYRDAFTALDTTLENDIDDFFGAPTPSGPDLLINPSGSDPAKLSRTRAHIARLMNAWSARILDADRRDPLTLLAEAEEVARNIQTFADAIAETANRTDSRATEEQLASLASARAAISATLSAITATEASYRSGSTASTASVDAGVKSALGNLRLAQANLEKTVIRAPIAGTINFLPIRVGQYVTALEHVATVAQNGALEIIAYVSEEERQALSVGARVRIEGAADGLITAISPALDPRTRQIEVRIAASNDAGSLVNGETVRVILPAVERETAAGPWLLPLSAVKLSAENRIIFTVEDGALIAIPVEVGEVRGERLEVLTPLDASLRIVTDARGLAEGQRVHVVE